MTYCWNDPRMQGKFKKEFVDKFSSSGNPWAVDHKEYQQLIRRAGGIFDDKIKNTFKSQDLQNPNGEWVVRLTTTKDSKVLLPLEEVFNKIESEHMREGSHKAKTTLYNQLKADYYNISLPMVEFLLDRCPQCQNSKKQQKKDGGDESVPSDPTNSSQKQASPQKCLGPQRTLSEVPPQDQRSSKTKELDLIQIGLAAERAIRGITNTLLKATVRPEPEVLPPMQSPTTSQTSFIGKSPNISTSSDRREIDLGSMFTSTPNVPHKSNPRFVPFKVNTPNLQKFAQSGNAKAATTNANDIGSLSLSNNFVDFLNNSNMTAGNQSGQKEYLDIIREEQSTLNADANSKGNEEQHRKGSESMLNQRTVEQQQSSIPRSSVVQSDVKEEPFDYECALQHIEYMDEEMLSPDRQQILLELAKVHFGGWQLKQSRSDQRRYYFYCARTGKSQNDEPALWAQEVEKKLEDVNKLKQADDARAQTNEQSHEGNHDEVLRPFNSTADVVNIIFPQNNPTLSTSAADDEEEIVRRQYLKEVCEQFEDELQGDNLLEVLEQGNVNFEEVNNGGEAAAENGLNFENIPIDGEIGLMEQVVFNFDEPNFEEVNNRGAKEGNNGFNLDNIPVEGGESGLMESIETELALPKSLADEGTPQTVDEVNVANSMNETLVAAVNHQPQQAASEQNSSAAAIKKARKPPQTARKRSSALIIPQMVGLETSNQNFARFEAAEEDTKDIKHPPPPYLVPRMPKIRIVIKAMPQNVRFGDLEKLIKESTPSASDDTNYYDRVLKMGMQKARIGTTKKESDVAAEVSTSSSVASTPFLSRSRASPIRLNPNQDIYRCVECERIFASLQDYHLHEASRHRNCITANGYVLEYLQRLNLQTLMDINFICRPCNDKQFECAYFWAHMEEKHNETIRTEHDIITKRLAGGDGEKQRFPVKKEAMIVYEDEKDKNDELWRGKDGQWAKNELGKKKTKRGRSGEGSSGTGKRRQIKMEFAAEEKEENVAEADNNGKVVLQQPSAETTHPSLSALYQTTNVVIVVGQQQNNGGQSCQEVTGIGRIQKDRSMPIGESSCCSSNMAEEGTTNAFDEPGKERLHSSPNQNCCQFCKRQFQSVGELTAHVSNNHLKEIMAKK